MTESRKYDLRGSKEKKHLSTYGMFLFYILLPFEYPLVTLGVGSILRYTGILTMGLAVLDLFRDGGKVRIDYRIGLLLTWIAYAAISGLWCSYKSQYSYYISMYINNSLMFLLISAVQFTQDDAQLVEKGYVGGIVLLLLYMTFVPGAVVSSSWQSRLTLAYNGKELLDQNYLAAIMVMQYGLLLYDILHKEMKRTQRIISVVLCLTIIYYILCTGSRGGLLAAGAITIVCICTAFKKRKATVLALLCVGVMVTPFVLDYLPENLVERFSLEAMTGGTSESGSRLKIWKIALKAILSGNIFFGYGAGSAESIIGLSYSYNAAIHNAVIAHILELGFVGLGLFVGLIVKMIQELLSYQCRKWCIAFIGIVVASIFLDVLTTKFFWAAMMILSIQISSHRSMIKRNKDSLNGDAGWC